MTSWDEFRTAARQIAEIFLRRLSATGNLCLIATIRSDGYPRISPMELRVFEGELVLVGMPGTTKFADLGRDPRFCLHTATVDPYVGDGDVKLWGLVRNVRDAELYRRFAEDLYAESGFDLRGQRFDPFYVADLTGGSSVEFVDNQLRVTIWKPGEDVRVVRKA